MKILYTYDSEVPRKRIQALFESNKKNRIKFKCKHKNN